MRKPGRQEEGLRVQRFRVRQKEPSVTFTTGNYWGRCLLFDYLCSKENCYSRMRIGVKLTRTVGEPGARWYGQGEIRKRTLGGVVYCFTIRKPGRQEKSNTVREKYGRDVV